MDENNQGYNQQFQAPSFEQTSQEFYPHSQGVPHQPAHELGQHATPEGWINQGVHQTDPFGGNVNSEYPLGGSNLPQGGFGGFEAHSNPFDATQGHTGDFGGSQGYTQNNGGDLELKWWQKGARVFLIGGAGLLILSILVFVVATKIKNRPPKPVTDVSKYVEAPVDTPVDIPVDTPVDTPVEQHQPVQVEPPVHQAIPDGWQEVSNTSGYNFVETRQGEFIVVDLVLYYKNDGGVQIRSAAKGSVDGYPGVYEVDLPRSAALFDKITVGSKFRIQFDVYRAADSPTIFLENLRPD